MNLSMKNGTVSINGRAYSGRSVIIDGQGQVTVDGVVQEGTLAQVINITINGNVESLETSSGNVTVNGSAHHVKTVNGEVTARDVEGDVTTVNGDVRCASINGATSTVNGTIGR